MFKFIGVLTVIGAFGLCVAVYTEVLNFSASVSLTPKGDRELNEIRDYSAGAIRNLGEAAASVTEGK